MLLCAELLVLRHLLGDTAHGIYDLWRVYDVRDDLLSGQLLRRASPGRAAFGPVESGGAEQVRDSGEILVKAGGVAERDAGTVSWGAVQGVRHDHDGDTGKCDSSSVLCEYLKAIQIFDKSFL